MKAQGWGEGKGDTRRKEEAAGEKDGVGDFDRDGASLRVKWKGANCRKGSRASARGGRVTRGDQNARCGDSKIPKKRDRARDEDGSATAWGAKTGAERPGKGQAALRRADAKGTPGDATGGPHVGGRGDARPGPLPPGSAAAAPTRSTGSSEAAEARALVTQPVAQPPPPPLPPAEATHASPLARPQQPQSRLETRSRETIGLYREIPAAARRMSREA